jgi:OOP family OmpA-OmpF porin
MLNKYLSLIIILTALFGTSHAQIDIYSKQATVGNKINSSSQELNCVISPDGKKMYFTRGFHPANIGGATDKGDIWVSELDSTGDWMDAINLGSPLNTDEDNRIIGFMDDGRAMLLQSEIGIAFSYNINAKWTKATQIEIPYFKLKSPHQSASISADGRYLLFGMETYGSYGVEDLYMCKLLPTGKWSSPKNLGHKINTPYQEQTPFIAADNKTLFYASNGRGGQGSYDIFMAERLDESWQNWSEPKNLGKKVNSKGQETSFVFSQDADFAYLISTQNSDGYGDIKRVKITPHITEDTTKYVRDVDAPVIVKKEFIDFKGKVFDKLTKEPIESVQLQIITEPDTLKYTTISNSSGFFETAIQKGAEYEIKISAPKYLIYENILTQLELNSSSELSYYLEPLKKGNTIALDHVLFHKGTANLVEGSEHQLEQVVQMMISNPDIYIFLKGHTDNQGKASINLQLSNSRVETVQKFLTSNGIKKKRVEGQGFGGLKPIASNASEETRKFNRRVEFTIQ